MVNGPDPAFPVLLEVGRIHKPHGLAGEVVVSLVSPRTERLDPGTVLQTASEPLVVETSRPHGQRFLVKFDRINDRNEAEFWSDGILLAEPIDDPDDETLWVHELVGCAVVDQHGSDHGLVAAVIDNPASDLLELQDGQLVPLVFLVDHIPGQRILVEIPDGLLDSKPPE